MATIDQLIQQSGLKVVDHSHPEPETKIVNETETPAPEEVAAVETKPEAPVQEDRAPVADWYKVAGERIGREFKGEEDFTEWHGSLKAQEAKLTEYETKEQQWAEEREELAKGIDPMQYFASPELFTLNGLLKKFPERNPLALTEISTKDFSKSYLESPVEMLALDLMLEHPGIYANKAEAIEDIYAKYSIDDPEDIGAQAKRRMQVDAKTATDKFAGIKAQIEIPAKVDLNATKA